MSTEQTIKSNTDLGVKENYEQFKNVIDLIIKDFEKFNIKNTKIAGVRVKNNLLICRKISETIENQIMEKIRNIPSKHRTDVDSPVVLPHENTEVVVKTRKPRRANKPKTEGV